MSILPFVSQDYQLIDAYEGTASVRQSGPISQGIVVLENGEPIGVLTASDLAKRQHRIVIDCLTEKPNAYATDRVADILGLMEASGNNVLMVYDQKNFVGLISQNDIMSHLQSSLVLQKLKVQSAAHDLKNPLASIKLIADILHDSLTLAHDRELLGYLLQSCLLAQKIIDDILLTEQIAEGALVAVEENLDAVIAGCLNHFSMDIQRKQLSLAAELNFGGTVLIDRDKLERAIHNLLSNAIKFSHEKGNITIKTQGEGSMVKITVRDCGIGIPAALQGRIFDKFTEARRPGTGGEPPTGLGMYITKQIIELHGGKVELKSDGNSGTAVYIFLQLPPSKV